MKVHTVKANIYPGTDIAEVYPRARKLYNQIKSHTKRQPYVRSSYFHKEKIFIELFWVHLNQKNRKDRIKRLKYYGVGIETLRSSRQLPIIKKNPNRPNELLYRFGGITSQGDLFYVQVKENIRTKRKDLMSIFPVE